MCKKRHLQPKSSQLPKVGIAHGLSIEDENLKQLRQRGETLLLWFSPGGITGTENFWCLKLASKAKVNATNVQNLFPD